jgi:hypothetical protein
MMAGTVDNRRRFCTNLSPIRAQSRGRRPPAAGRPRHPMSHAPERGLVQRHGKAYGTAGRGRSPAGPGTRQAIAERMVRPCPWKWIRCTILTPWGDGAMFVYPIPLAASRSVSRVCRDRWLYSRTGGRTCAGGLDRSHGDCGAGFAGQPANIVAGSCDALGTTAAFSLRHGAMASVPNEGELVVRPAPLRSLGRIPLVGTAASPGGRHRRA